MAEPLLRLDAATKRFGATTAVEAVSLDIQAGEFFALLGPSGCGKTTLMRLIAGFETPDSGRILIDGEDMARRPPHRRPVNMMFQSYALFPHMSVERNIAFGLVQEGMPKAAIASRVAEMLDLVQLPGLGSRRPQQLSGGQKQRVALARALAKRPRLLLLDEPLAALDRKLREETQFELMRIQRELGTAFLVVTHDQDEAMAMSQRIAVMRMGVIEQVGSPRDVYAEPANAFVAGFIGRINMFAMRVTAIEGARAMLMAESLTLETTSEGLDIDAEVLASVRPEDVGVAPAADARITGVLVDAAFLGERSLLRIRLDSGAIVQCAQMNVGAMPERGARVGLSIAPSAVRVLQR
jgi:putrescine transport system ATP-binding protein